MFHTYLFNTSWKDKTAPESVLVFQGIRGRFIQMGICLDTPKTPDVMIGCKNQPSIRIAQTSGAISQRDQRKGYFRRPASLTHFGWNSVRSKKRTSRDHTRRWRLRQNMCVKTTPGHFRNRISYRHPQSRSQSLFIFNASSNDVAILQYSEDTFIG